MLPAFQEFVSPALLGSGVGLAVLGLWRQTRRQDREFDDQFGAVLEYLGYRGPVKWAPGVIAAHGRITFERDFHGVQLVYAAWTDKAQEGRLAFERSELLVHGWSADGAWEGTAWRILSKRFDDRVTWGNQCIPTGDSDLDSRFYIAGDVEALRALLQRDRTLRSTLLGLGWVDLRLGDGFIEFMDEQNQLISAMVGGSVGARFTTTEERLHLVSACHEQIAELLARVVRAGR